MKITPRIVRELLNYDPETGEFTWRSRGCDWFGSECARNSWNTKHAGKRAGSTKTDGDGYQSRHIVLRGKHYLEHRLAWLWMTNEEIPEEIDHLNRDATDNRWRNLRALTRAQNCRNLSRRKDNVSGIAGVGWNKRDMKWHARCGLDGKLKHLGYFSEIDEAALEVLEFRAEHGFYPGHGMEVAHYHRGEN